MCLAAHLIVRMSRILTSRLLCPAPANAMMASRCSCPSPAGPGALMGALLTCGSEAIPVLVRPCSLMELRAALCLPPPQAASSRSSSHHIRGICMFARAPRKLFHPRVLSRLCLSTLWLLRAQALFQRCSSVCGRMVFFSLLCCPVYCCPRILPTRS